MYCSGSYAVAMQKKENSKTLQTSTPELHAAGKPAAETPSPNHIDTTSQQGANDKPTEQSGDKKSCVMAKANSLNEVNSRDFDTLSNIAYTRTSLDAESCPTANRKRRKRYSPSCNIAQKVSEL